MRDLPKVAVVAVGTEKFFGPTVMALMETLKKIKPAKTFFFSDVAYEFKEHDVNTVIIPTIRSKDEYSRFMLKTLPDFMWSDANLGFSHILVIQHDGYVLDADAWTDEFLEYDYIGAPWDYKDSRNVGNGGFSLRSTRLMDVVQGDKSIEILTPEDEIICRLYRHHLEKEYDIKFAPEELAHKFAFEQHEPMQPTFGFHNHFHKPFRPHVVLQRAGAMGDVIMMEPVMEWFYTHGYRVILDTPVEFYSLFQDHFFQIEHISQFVKGIPAGTRFINLDMAYEVSPQLPVLAAYYRVAGITDGQMRNAYLNFKATTETRLFDKYVVLHIDDTAMAHRNVHGVDWAHVSDAIDRMGYKPIQVGFSQEVGIQVKTSARRTLAHIVGGADAFIGIDSGCGQIAVACGIKTMLFFGSVNPEMRYPNMDNVEVVQNTCPVQRDGCYHKVISEVGQECTVDIKQPPCITHTTESVIKRIQNFLQQ